MRDRSTARKTPLFGPKKWTLHDDAIRHYGPDFGSDWNSLNGAQLSTGPARVGRIGWSKPQKAVKDMAEQRRKNGKANPTEAGLSLHTGEHA